MNTFKQDICDLLSGRRGGHTQKWLYADHTRPDGILSGSALWHDFVTANRNYYPIQSEIDMIPALVRSLRNDFDTVVDFGIGDSKALHHKTKPILRAQKNLKRYYPIDISNDNLETGLHDVITQFPHIIARGIQGDFYEGQSGIEGDKRLGLFLGTTISNIDMKLEEGFPRAEIVRKLATLAQTVKGDGRGSLVVSFDSNPDLDHALAAYQHSSWQRMMTGLMYDVQRLLHPEGKFNPSMWYYEGVIDREHRVLHQTIGPSIDQDFTIEGERFQIPKGRRFVVKNNWKPTVDQIYGMIEEAGLAPKTPVRGDSHPMIMAEAEVV